jgi:hypothetical protein
MTDPSAWASPGSAAPESGDARAVPPAPDPSVASDEIDSEIPLRPLGVSEILDAAITYVRRNPRATLGMSAVLTAVIQVLITLTQYFVIGTRPRADLTPAVVERTLGLGAIVLGGGLVLTALVVLLLSGLLAPVMARTLLGRSTSLDRAWRDVKPLLPRVVGTASAVVAIVLVAGVVPYLPLVLAVVTGAPAIIAALAWVFAVAVSVAAMVAGYVWFAFATPILVLERRSVRGALRRSADVVRGHWWRMFGAMLLTLVITIFAQFLVLPLPFTIVQQALLGANPEPSGWPLLAYVAIGAAGRIIAGTLLTPFNAGVIALLYADQRMRREAFDLELQMDPPDDPIAAWLPGPLTAAGSGRQPKTHRPSIVAPPPGPR